MVRTYKPTTERNKINEEDVKTAISEVVAKTLSLRAAASKYNIHVSTLQHRVAKFKSDADNPAVLHDNAKKFSSKYTVAQVFTNDQENKLAEYLINCSKMHYGLTMKQTMVLAYEYAEHLKCKYPESWKVNGCAGKDWVMGFRFS
jgi:transposase